MLLLRGGSAGGRETRVIASRTLAASSANWRSGRHSSSPSCQTSDSSVMAPSAALRRTSATRMGPTGTPLMATYHSSLAEEIRHVDRGRTLLASGRMRAPGQGCRRAFVLHGVLERAFERAGNSLRLVRGVRAALGLHRVRLRARWLRTREAGCRGPCVRSIDARQCRRHARLGDRSTDFDQVPAFAALHAHSPAHGLVVGDLVLRFALFAEEFHACVPAYKNISLASKDTQRRPVR